jgi:hypothetical protein
MNFIFDSGSFVSANYRRSFALTGGMMLSSASAANVAAGNGSSSAKADGAEPLEIRVQKVQEQLSQGPPFWHSQRGLRRELFDLFSGAPGNEGNAIRIFQLWQHSQG